MYRPAKLLDAVSVYLRIGVGSGNNYSANAGGDESVGAGAGASEVRTRFQRDICGRAACEFAGLSQGDDFRVVALVILMKAGANQLSFAHNHAANGWIGRCKPNALSRQSERLGHPALVEC